MAKPEITGDTKVPNAFLKLVELGRIDCVSFFIMALVLYCTDGPDPKKADVTIPLAYWKAIQNKKLTHQEAFFLILVRHFTGAKGWMIDDLLATRLTHLPTKEVRKIQKRLVKLRWLLEHRGDGVVAYCLAEKAR